MAPVLQMRARPRLLDGPREAWPRMLAAIDGARERVHFEVYAFFHDRIGKRFIAALSQAARRGCEVNVTVDAWGSMGSARAVAAALRRAGCACKVHNQLGAAISGRLGRNHRKLLVVDGEVAFVGGMNVGDRFAEWEDVAVELRGPACAALQHRLHGEHHVDQNGPLRVHLSRMGGGKRLFRRYVKSFAAARTRLLVAHSYFLPSRRLVRSLKAAARRGVEVTLLLPGRSDVLGARAAMSTVLRELTRAGVRCFAWTRSVLHAKMAVIDGEGLLVGSFNLDPLSLANLEALLVADDPELAHAGARWIELRLAGAVPLTPTNGFAGLLLRALGRLALWFVTLVARLLRA